MSERLKGKQVLLAVGGGIAAYKTAFLVRLLVKAGARVRVAMTKSATEFITPLTMQTLSGQPVATTLFDLGFESEIGHIQAADDADIVVVAPTTANLLARMARGMTNDVVTAIVSATLAPVLIAPSMNVNMWNNPVTQDALKRLVEVRGFQVIGPGSGFLACKWDGQGRLSEPEDIVEAMIRVLTPQDLKEKKIIVSAGGTREALDPVRFLGNRSTGKMGYAVALAALRRGAEVDLISAQTCLSPPAGAEVVIAKSAGEMHREVMGRSKGAHAVVMAAAVADYRPREKAAQKIKKSEGELSLSLHRTKDVLAELGASSVARPVLIGFAAETEDVRKNAEAKRVRKNVDLIVANDVSRSDAGFNVDTNQVTLCDKDGSVELELMDKIDVGHKICDWLSARLSS